MKKGLSADCRYCFFAVLLAAAVGFSALLLVYLLPVERMDRECRQSAAFLKTQDTNPRERYSDKMLDNWSDCIMLMEAAYPGPESVPDKTVNNYYWWEYGGDPRAIFVDIYAEGKTGIPALIYARYWPSGCSGGRPGAGNRAGAD